MRGAEERYPRYPESIPELMERAGAAVAREAMAAYPAARRFACVCGGGSNGGDGRVAARVLREAGLEADETEEVEGYDVVVDALFGTGSRGAARGGGGADRPDERGRGARRVRRSALRRRRVDGGGRPSGRRRGPPRSRSMRRRSVSGIAPGRFTRAGSWSPTSGSRPSRPSIDWRRRAARAGPAQARGRHEVHGRRRARRRGPAGMSGAACLIGPRRAACADAGYVTLAVPAESLPVVEGLALEPVKVALDRRRRPRDDTSAAERAGSLALGPGLGRGEARQALVRNLLRAIELPRRRRRRRALRPRARRAVGPDGAHAASRARLARLLGTDAAWVGAHRLEAARSAAARFERSSS